MMGGLVETTMQETTTVTSGDATYASDTFSDTTADTSNYSRYFDTVGNPTYMPDVTFSLD